MVSEGIKVVNWDCHWEFKESGWTMGKKCNEEPEKEADQVIFNCRLHYASLLHYLILYKTELSNPLPIPSGFLRPPKSSCTTHRKTKNLKLCVH